MAPDEYSTGGGGKLKLKGSKVVDGRVEKKKKKKEKKEKKEREGGQEVKDASGDDVERQQGEKSGSPGYDREQGEGGPKTETERKYEEVRRKRLRERLQRDGVKTHKERVEDLNKYLSRLSEHHDMPKIGPG